MTADALVLLARANVVASAAIILVLALRRPVRLWLGPDGAYALWLAVPAAIFGSLTPIGWETAPAEAVASADAAGIGWLGERATLVAGVWAAGFVAIAGLALWRQARFAAATRAGRAGPAAVGVIQPRLVIPRDFADRFSPDERRLIVAHERTHMERQDGRWGAVAELLAWICWFNPLAHAAVRAIRLDQELACDAAVVRRLPAARRAYAETLLRTHVEPAALGLASHWRAPTQPLELRLQMLARRGASDASAELGLAALAALSLALFAAAWALTPMQRPMPTVVLMDLAPADPAIAARVYAELPRH